MCVSSADIMCLHMRVPFYRCEHASAYRTLIAPGRQGGRHSLTFVNKFCGCSRKEPPPGHRLIFDDSPALLILKSKPVRVNLDRRGLILKLARSKQTGTGTGTGVHFRVMMHACFLEHYPHACCVTLADLTCTTPQRVSTKQNANTCPYAQLVYPRHVRRIHTHA